MKLTLDRKYPKSTYTIGNFFINGQYFSNSLEPKDRGLTQDMDENTIFDIKAAGNTAIPRGIYRLEYTYSPKYKKYMLQVMNVPGFAGVIITGNNKDQTEGCILLGKNTKVGQVTCSRATMMQLTEILRAAIHGGQKIELEIK